MGYGLCRVNYTAAADGEDKIGLKGNRLLDRFPHPAQAGIGLYTALGLREQTRILQGVFHFLQQAVFYHAAAAVDDEHTLGVIGE